MNSLPLDGLGVLVTGGAGYIGSHVVYELLAAGCRVVAVDDLSTGRRDLVAPAAAFVEGDIGDSELLARVIAEHHVGAVVHLAGSVVVSESVARPLDYYGNNVVAARTLISSCVEHGVGRFVFSSTAAVYGQQDAVAIPEECPPAPANPYGRSKLMVEWMLADVSSVTGMAAAVLRYFNVAGADPEGRTGQAGPHSTHLIKVACEAAVGLRDFVEVYGTDYPTEDGTCIRDYVHVSDLAAAHVAALAYLCGSGGCLTLNCGYGRGYSVRQVLDAVERQAQCKLDVRNAPRRAGDVLRLVADASNIVNTLGWKPRYDALGVIVGTALAWERTLLAGIPCRGT
jgi:UDP-glucose 4-epimerase